jgi:hypothetical protein
VNIGRLKANEFAILVRLSFITADDQQKFEQLFRSAIPPNEQALSGMSRCLCVEWGSI